MFLNSQNWMYEFSIEPLQDSKSVMVNPEIIIIVIIIMIIIIVIFVKAEVFKPKKTLYFTFSHALPGER